MPQPKTVGDLRKYISSLSDDAFLAIGAVTPDGKYCDEQDVTSLHLCAGGGGLYFQTDKKLTVLSSENQKEEVETDDF